MFNQHVVVCLNKELRARGTVMQESGYKLLKSLCYVILLSAEHVNGLKAKIK